MRGRGLSDALQRKFQKSVAEARSRGIDSRKRKTKDRIKEQKQKIDQIRQSDTDNRSKFLQQQGGIQNLSNLLKKQQEETLRDSIESSFGKGVVRKSDFLGRDPQGFLGLFGPDTIAATTINPYSGERITTSKAREGLTTPEYSQFMSNLYDINPELGYETFVPGPMKLINKGMELATPFPLKLLASTMEGGKDIADYFSGKARQVGTDLSDQMKRYYEGIRSLNPFKEKPVVEDSNAYRGELDFFEANRPFPQKNMTFMPLIGQTLEDALNRKVFGPAPMNQGGLASLNNADYSMLMNASNFGF